ncbi:ribosomal RNA small subunit methyltransferase A [Patescibacteria group bacterium]|nr:ribosomal RNA small subunit methyltransferase A [Patescibacteria group bacterium]
MSQYLGQHFLKNKTAARKIVNALAIKPGDTVIEIGPGKGALTGDLHRAVTNAKGKLILVEIDRDIAVTLHEKYSSDPVVKIVNADALTALPEVIAGLEDRPYAIIGNIPYYITGKLLRTIGDLPHLPQRTVLMIQKEVAERVSARPPRMNLLAAAVQLWAEPKLLFTLSPEDFDPPPQVNSAVISLGNRPAQADEHDRDAYYRLLHIIFKQPRKTLLNNLAEGASQTKSELEELIAPLGYDQKTRPQELSVDRIRTLASLFKEKGIEIPSLRS